jgi:5'-nucleotidase
VDNPLIILTNDDGITSDGLWAVAEALMPLGDVLVVAPDRQWSGGGRSMPPTVTGQITPYLRELGDQSVMGYAVDGSPALVVQHAILELASRKPSLIVSGVNYGYNLGNEVTVSGTVGAALEAAAFGIPALAMSLEMHPKYHHTGDSCANYAAARTYARYFAQYILVYSLPFDADVININLPADATPETPWHLTTASRKRYYIPVAPDRTAGSTRPGYRVMENLMQVSADSDIWAVQVDRVVSVTPLSLDLTTRADMDQMENDLLAGIRQLEYVNSALEELAPSAREDRVIPTFSALSLE